MKSRPTSPRRTAPGRPRQRPIVSHVRRRRTSASRALADDATVSAAALAEADHEAEFHTLKIQSRQAAVEAIEAELRTARAERFADEFGRAHQPLREEFDQSLAGLDVALDRVVAAWRAHAAFIRDTYTTAAHIDRAATARIKFFQYGPYTATIDKTPLHALPVHQPVQALFNKAMGALNARLKP